MTPFAAMRFKKKPTVVGGIAFVQKTAQTFYDNVTTASQTITGVTSGSLLVCVLAVCDVANTPNGAAYAAPSGWTLAVNLTGPVNANSYMPIVGIYYKQGASSGSHTAAFTTLRSGSYAEITLLEFSGLSATAALDKTAIANSPNNTKEASHTVTTAATTQAAELVIAIGSPGSEGATNFLAPTSGFTEIDHEPTDTVHFAYSSGYKIVSATGAQAATWSWTTATDFQGAVATFK